MELEDPIAALAADDNTSDSGPYPSSSPVLALSSALTPNYAGTVTLSAY